MGILRVKSPVDKPSLNFITSAIGARKILAKMLKIKIETRMVNIISVKVIWILLLTGVKSRLSGIAEIISQSIPFMVNSWT
ncbi:hypothetical protein SDC9_106128 [bioreactor metagenome]|uniref:Uncharacterized protein n=1 Tax=bioreactor metagenome TaxID=1076179 RepID=A0A645B2I8_9ZZZZ